MDQQINEEVLQKTIDRCREKGILLPTYEQMANPELIPEGIKEELKTIGLWDLNPLNLFRITWKNQPIESGGGYGRVNFIELPQAFTGVPCRMYMLIGKFFPTGAHKVGATFGPLVEKLTRGAFDPTRQKALWPSTGNYCRGGAFNSHLLGCKCIAVLPEEMSRERFEWLQTVGAEIIATPGCESNVKEIFDKTSELSQSEEIVPLNQFCEFGNPLWHYRCTGPAMEEVIQQECPNARFSGVFLTQGSAGTLGAAEYLKEKYPNLKVGAGEARQCPTLLLNGFGGHRIEGIGDKHVPWVHNLRNTDVVASIDDERCMCLLRLFNTEEGRACLIRHGIPESFVQQLSLLGISGIANMIGAIKMAKYYEYNANDAVFTISTDSCEMYRSRLTELQAERGDYTAQQAEIDFQMHMLGVTTDWMEELTYTARKRCHNLKYFTWIEQQGKTVEELNAQWYDDQYWTTRWHCHEQWDERIRAFNARTGLDAKYQ
eukprot:gnl/Trimastix_PCT/212.p2 GENE.gnl/Trimastix_PCT/212~~gnl/Trimastix_PCT/212.p2  ORF type:complete len:488 (-),score=187.54 gnl/Trimastix_PCT/212:51-1514(-)